MLATFFTQEPVVDREALLARVSHKQSTQSSVGYWLKSTLVTPFAEFFSRNGVKLAASFLLFIFLFKIGEAFLGRMSLVGNNSLFYSRWYRQYPIWHL